MNLQIDSMTYFVPFPKAASKSEGMLLSCFFLRKQTQCIVPNKLQVNWLLHMLWWWEDESDFSVAIFDFDQFTVFNSGGRIVAGSYAV